jgi:hypothetical protein
VNGGSGARGPLKPNEKLMRNQHILLFALCCTLTACGRLTDNSSPTASETTAQDRKDYEERVKRQQAQFDSYDQQAKRAEQLLATQEQFMKRQMEAFARFEKILDTWESQQKRYQKYLDSLPK